MEKTIDDQAQILIRVKNHKSKIKSRLRVAREECDKVREECNQAWQAYHQAKREANDECSRLVQFLQDEHLQYIDKLAEENKLSNAACALFHKDDKIGGFYSMGLRNLIMDLQQHNVSDDKVKY